jgi:hypothetical protein
MLIDENFLVAACARTGGFLLLAADFHVQKGFRLLKNQFKPRINTDNSFCFQSVSIRVHPWLMLFSVSSNIRKDIKGEVLGS